MFVNGELLFLYAMQFVGKPYIWGGDDPVKGFDCSGLVQELLHSVGLLPDKTDRNAQGLFDLFHHQPTTFARFGSLLFFGKSPKEVTHVGFALDERNMLEAGGGGSKTLTAEDAAKQNAYIRMRPISRRGDLVGALHPTYPWEKLNGRAS
jgi:cell wall-associated NlpC family hydrolase